MIPRTKNNKKKTCRYRTFTFHYQVSLSYAHLIFYSAIKKIWVVRSKPWGGNVSTATVSKEHQLLGSWGFVLFSDFKLNSISKLGVVFPSCYCQDVLPERALPTDLDADVQRLLLPAASLGSQSHTSAHQPWVNWVAFKSFGTWWQCLNTTAA